MASKAALKRQADETAAQPAKRNKHGGEDIRKCKEITAGLRQVEGMPRDVAKLLGDMLEVALVPFADERHDLQRRVVALGDDALRGHESNIQAKIAGAEEAIARSEEIMAPQQQVIDRAELLLSEKSDSEQGRKRALADTARAFRAAKKALDGAEIACQALDGELQIAVDKKEKLETMQTELVLPLTEGNLDKEKKDSTVVALVEILETLDMPSSIMVAIPASFSKAPEQRGSFDTMVVNQLKEELAARIGAAVSEIEQAEPNRVAREAARVAAQAALDAAKASQLEGAQQFWGSQAETKSAQEELEAKQVALYEVQREQKIQRRTLSQAVAKLDGFQSGALATFAALRDREKPDEPAAVESVPVEGTPAEYEAVSGEPQA